MFDHYTQTLLIFNYVAIFFVVPLIVDNLKTNKDKQFYYPYSFKFYLCTLVKSFMIDNEMFFHHRPFGLLILLFTW